MEDLEDLDKHTHLELLLPSRLYSKRDTTSWVSILEELYVAFLCWLDCLPLF